MIIWVNQFGAKLATKNFNGTIGYNLVCVHIRLSSRTSLPDNKGEVFVELALDDLVRSLDNGISDIWLQTEVEICLRSVLF